MSCLHTSKLSVSHTHSSDKVVFTVLPSFGADFSPISSLQHLCRAQDTFTDVLSDLSPPQAQCTFRRANALSPKHGLVSDSPACWDHIVQGLEQPGNVKGVPAHGRRWNGMSFKVLPTQTILEFYGTESCAPGVNVSAERIWLPGDVSRMLSPQSSPSLGHPVPLLCCALSPL